MSSRKKAKKEGFSRETEETMGPEMNNTPCNKCKGPFEFWGLSTESKAYRCITCQVIHFLPKNGSKKSHNRKFNSIPSKS
jgi:hypothetical protein